MEKYTLAKASIENGMIISFNYKKKDGTRKQYTVIVIDSSYNGKLHALHAGIVSPGELGPSLGVMSSNRIKRARGLDIPVIQNIESAPQEEGYRTFILQNINKVEVVKYPFPKSIWDVSSELHIPTEAIKGQKALNVLEHGEGAEQVEDDVIVQQIKEKLQQEFEGLDE
tara:strand:+ start:902 stop:1408 length:507 start_codon:yes stop_codon:yes gene_type:complete